MTCQSCFSQLFAYVYILVQCFNGVQSAATPQLRSNFKNWQPPKALNRTVDVNELTHTFTSMMRGMHGGAGNEQLAAIEAAMLPAFKALPKNEFQGLSHSATSYLVHEYFARTYQWHLRGLGSGPNVMKSSDALLHKATILQEMAPQLVEGLLEAQEAGHGLTLSDAAAMAATLHNLVRSDAETLLETTFGMLAQSLGHTIGKQAFNQTMLAFAYVSSGLLEKSKEFFVKRMQKPTHFMREFLENALNIAETLAFQQHGRINPFKPRAWNFNDVLDLVERVLREFGQWQDSSCAVMRDHLTSLDPNGAGRVPLGVFYAQPDMGNYRFSESAEYLQRTGSLDSSEADRPQVLISNYVLGPGNCFSSSTYFQFCCVNDCSRVMAEIENYVAGPSAVPQEILYAVGNASERVDDITLAEQAQQLPEILIEKLQMIAKRHGGKVPLHGRLFAQWLHFAFPATCPYPHIPANDAGNDALTASDFMNSKSAAEKEMQRHIETSGGPNSSSERSLSQWTDDEIFPFQTLPTHSSSFSLRAVFRVVALCVVLAATILSLIRSSHAADASLKLVAEDKMDKLV